MGIVLQLHAIWRWVLLVAAGLVVLKALVGWLGKQRFGDWDDRLGLVFTVVVDVQFLLGMILWLFGDTGFRVLANAMSQPYLRFIALEHGILMLVALILAHIGRARTRRGVDSGARHRAAFIFYLLSLIFIVLIFVMQQMAK